MRSYMSVLIPYAHVTNFCNVGHSWRVSVNCNSCCEFEADSAALNVFWLMYPSHAFFQSRGQASRDERSQYQTGNIQYNLAQTVPTDAHVINWHIS